MSKILIINDGRFFMSTPWQHFLKYVYSTLDKVDLQVILNEVACILEKEYDAELLIPDVGQRTLIFYNRDLYTEFMLRWS